MFNERFTPLFAMPFGIHLIAMIISVIVLVLRYREKHFLYQLLMLIGVVSTSLVYFVSQGITFYILAFEEIILFSAAVFFMIKETAAEEKALEEEEKKLEAEKAEAGQ